MKFVFARFSGLTMNLSKIVKIMDKPGCKLQNV